MVRAWLVVIGLLIPSTLWAGSLFDEPDLPGRKVGIVIPTGPAGSWDADIVESPTVVRDGQRWVMLYTGYADGVAQIGSAVSQDGEHWEKRGVSLAPGPGEAGVAGAVLVPDGDRWLLYYVGFGDRGYESGEKSIRLATSDSPTGPWKRRGVMVETGGKGWRSVAVWRPFVVEHEGRWFMFFNASGADYRETIGFATAPSVTGPWAVDDSRSPVFEPVPESWESQIVGDPFLRRTGSGWEMTYFGFGGLYAADAEAVTTDDDFPLGWKRTGRVLAPSEDYDARFAHKPWLVPTDRGLFHFYTAVDENDVRQIALVVR